MCKNGDFAYIDISSINLDDLSEIERKQILAEIIDLIKFNGDQTKEVDLSNAIQNEIQSILKEIQTEVTEIKFEGSEDFWKKESDIDVDVLRQIPYFKSIIEKKNEITEEDVFNYVKTFILVLENAVTITEFKAFSKYIPSNTDIKIKASIDELTNIEYIESLPENCIIETSIEKISQLDIEQIARIREKCTLNAIKINFGTRKDEYDINTYIKLRRKMEKIVEGIDIEAPEIERFTKVYERLAHKIEYDHESALYNESDGTEGTKNDNAHNMVGGLLENLCVCEGYSKILCQTLSLVNIDARYVDGKLKDDEQKPGHAWNVVNIDGQWYSTDLTWDASNIKDGTTPNYCLQSSEEFQHDEFIIENTDLIPETSITYNQDSIMEIFANRRFIIKNDQHEQGYSAHEIIDMIENLKKQQYISDGLDIELVSVFGEEYADSVVIISNMVENGKIAANAETTIIIDDKEQLLQFVEHFCSNSNQRTKILENGKTKVFTTDGISITLDESVKDFIRKNGLDIDSTFSPIHEITSDSLVKTINDLLAKQSDKKCDIQVGNLINDEYEVYIGGDNTTYGINEGELIEFLQRYSTDYNILNTDVKRGIVQYTTEQGVNLVMDRDTICSMIDTGICFAKISEENQTHKKSIYATSEIGEYEELNVASSESSAQQIDNTTIVKHTIIKEWLIEGRKALGVGLQQVKALAQRYKSKQTPVKDNIDQEHE